MMKQKNNIVSSTIILSICFGKVNNVKLFTIFIVFGNFAYFKHHLILAKTIVGTVSNLHVNVLIFMLLKVLRT